jgi:hypothetical protein
MIVAWALRTLNKEKPVRQFELVKTVSGPTNPVAAAVTRGYNAVRMVAKLL